MFPFYHYDVGNVVQVARHAPLHQVIWRGRQRIPLATGGSYEVAVYRLDNGYWDCYYEEQLHSALRWLGGE